MNICIVGPCALKDVLHLLHPSDGNRARGFNSANGIPVSSLAALLVELEHSITIVTTSDSLTEEMELRGKNFRLIVLPQRRRARYLALTLYSREIQKIRRVLKNLDVDVVNAHWTYEYALAALLSGKRCVITAHDAPWQVLKTAGSKKFWIFRFILAWIVRFNTKHMIFVSSDLQLKWHKEMIWRKVSRVIPNLPPFSISNSYKLSSSENRIRILSVGDTSARKNIQSSIVAFRTLKPDFPNIELHLVGLGLEKDGLFFNSQIVDELFLDIHWHGYLERTEFKALMESCQLLLQPSTLESFGLTLLEAMALGLPVIAGSNTGAAIEVVGESGVLIDTTSISEIILALRNLIENADLRLTFSRRGKLRIAQKFDTSKIVNLTLSYLEEVSKIT